jgi:hypothetical protein
VDCSCETCGLTPRGKPRYQWMALELVSTEHQHACQPMMQQCARPALRWPCPFHGCSLACLFFLFLPAKRVSAI